MKAILVIDVDDIERYHADIYRDDDKHNGECVAGYVPFAPLPNKKEIDNPDGYYDLSQLLNEGWNYCIDTITGEKDGL